MGSTCLDRCLSWLVFILKIPLNNEGYFTKTVMGFE